MPREETIRGDGSKSACTQVTLAAAARDFLAAKRIAVVGVSRDVDAAANFVFRKLRAEGYDVVPVAAHVEEIDGVRCVRNLHATGGAIESAVVFTPPEAAADVVRECAALGIKQVWLHRALGRGSVSDEAVAVARELGIHLIPGGCPAMYCSNADLPHRCMRTILSFLGKIPRHVHMPAA